MAERICGGTDILFRNLCVVSRKQNFSCVLCLIILKHVTTQNGYYNLYLHSNTTQNL